MLKPYLSPEFSETIAKQDEAFKDYNELLDTVNPEKIVLALSTKALDLSFNPEKGIEKTIVDAAEKVITKTNNGTQIGFGKENGQADAVWGLIHNDQGHKDAARHFNALRYSSDVDPKELENACKKRGYHTLVAAARMHAIANQAETENTAIA